MLGVRVPVKPELISWALRWADVALEDLKEPGKVSEWLDGTVQPTLRQLQDFARTLHVPFGYLMMSEPPVLDKPVPDFRRRQGKNRAYSTELTEAIYRQQHRQNWFRDYAREYGLMPVSWVGRASLDESPSDVAERMQEQWSFSVATKPQPYGESRKEVFEFLEDLDVLVSISGFIGDTRRSFDLEEFSGFSLADEYAPVIFVNGKESHAAQIFTMMHELGHLLLGQSALSDTDLDVFDSQPAQEAEQWCDAFAAAFLMPKRELQKHFNGDFTEEGLLKTAQRFRVSVLALLNRWLGLGLIPFDIWDNLYSAARDRALRVLADKASKKSSGGDFYRSHPFRVGNRFARAVIRDARSGRTPYLEAQKLIGIKKAAAFDNYASEIGA